MMIDAKVAPKVGFVSPFGTTVCNVNHINAGRQALPIAVATQERRLFPVACTPLFGAAQVSDSGPAGPPHCLGFPDPLSKSPPAPCACGGDPNAVRPLP